MSDITINYKGNAIATMDASGTKTLLTEGKYLEDDVEVVYTKPSGGGNAYLTLLGSGTYTRSVNDGQLSIPVTYTAGTVHLIKIVVPEPLADTAQGVGCAVYFDPNYIGDASGAYVGGGLGIARGRKADNTFANGAGYNPSYMTLSNDTLTAAQINTTYKWKANNYDWYIWGEPSS